MIGPRLWLVTSVDGELAISGPYTSERSRDLTARAIARTYAGVCDVSLARLSARGNPLISQYPTGEVEEWCE